MVGFQENGFQAGILFVVWWKEIFAREDAHRSEGKFANFLYCTWNVKENHQTSRCKLKRLFDGSADDG